MSGSADFISRFHQLEGVTIGDRKKGFFLLLQEYDSLKEDATSLNDIIESLSATSYLQQKFVIELFIYFRTYKELYSLFTGGNEILMKRLWKQDWFFQKLLQDATSNVIVNEVFTHLSYVSRMRFLNNIIYYTTDEVKADELFDLVLSKYGPKTADQMLAACSLKKIKEIINVRNIKFDNRKLLYLHKYKKNYVEELRKVNKWGKVFDFYDFNAKALGVLGGSDFDLFFSIFEQNDCPRVGKRLTRRILKARREFVLSNASDVHKMLHRRTLLKELKLDFKKFFFHTWPTSFKDFHIYSCFRSMKYYPKGKYLDLLQEGLQEVYGKTISNHPELISDELLEYTSDIEKRRALLEIKMKYNQNEYTLPQYYGTEESIPILKKKIDFADGIRTRENLLRALVHTCQINENPRALLEVLEYFSHRHKHDDESVRSSFLSEVLDNFDLLLLTRKHWEILFQIMKWDNIKSINSHIYSEMCVEYIKFLQRDNASMASMKSFLANYLDDIIKSQNKFKAVKNNAELEKFLINLLINKIQSICKDEDEKTHFCFALFEEILDWNSRHPEDPFDFLGISEIKESIKLKMKKGFGYNDSAQFYFHKFIKGEITCKDAQFQNEIEIIFWENFSEKYNNTIVEYYLRKNPTRILENFDTFIEVISEKWDSLCIWRFLKHYDHLQLPEKIIAYLKANKMIDFISMNTVIALATLMDPDEYMEYLPTPQNEKLDVDNGGESDNYKLASKFLTYAKYLNSNSVLPRIVDFCKGDYLHEALTPLYFYFFHSAEKHLLVELQNLSTRAVSVRKHAVKLACSVSTREIVFMLIKQMTDDEKNSSAKEHLFRKTFKYFLVDQSEDLYSLVQIQLNALDILESPAFKDTCTLRNLPEKYKLLFLKFIWNILDESENKGNDVSELRGKLVESLTTEIIHDLPYEFCSNLIKAKFLQFESVHKIPINNFVLNCIKHSKQKELILQDVFQVMSDFKNNYILHQDFNISQKSNSYIKPFISDIFYDFSYDKNLDKSIVANLFSHWTQLFTPRENIDAFTKLKLLVELKNVEDLNNYALKIGELFGSFVNEFGIVGIIDCFRDALEHVLPDYIFETDNFELKKYKLSSKLIEVGGDVNTKLLAISLLPDTIPENVECRKLLFVIMDKLKGIDDNALQINFNIFVSSLS